MSDVKRYDPIPEYIGSGDYIGGVIEDALGDYVRYKDYAEIRKQLERIRGQLTNCASLLHRLKRHGNASDALAADTAIDSANRALYETTVRAEQKEPE